MTNETWLKLFPFLNYDILASQVIYTEAPVLETTIVRETSQERNNLLFLKTPRVNSTTSKRTPPPGASRRTFGTNPLYNATKPSSRAIVTNAGYVQLYFGLTPGIFSAPWIRDFTTWMGNIRLNCLRSAKLDLHQIWWSMHVNNHQRIPRSLYDLRCI